MDKLVFVKEVRTITKGDRSWVAVSDQDNITWNVFQPFAPPVKGKSYMFSYEKNAKGWNDLKKIAPVENVFQQKAMKETANRNDVIRNFAVSFSYAKDMAVGKLIELDKVFEWSDKIYNYFQTKADEGMNEADTVDKKNAPEA